MLAFQSDTYSTADENPANTSAEKPKSQSEKPKSLDDFVLEVSNVNKPKTKKGWFYYFLFASMQEQYISWNFYFGKKMYSNFGIIIRNVIFA